MARDMLRACTEDRNKVEACMKTILFGAGIAALWLALPCAAQTPSDQQRPMHDRMEMRMMNDPVHQTAMMVFVLPSLENELGLSAQQTTDLRRMKQELVTKTKDLAQDAKNKELDATLSAMKAALSDEQRVKLAAMKTTEIHELAMARVPMEEHKIMAGFASPGMMGRGMMKRGKGPAQ